MHVLTRAWESVTHARTDAHEGGVRASSFCHVALLNWSSADECMGSNLEVSARNLNFLMLMRGNKKPGRWFVLRTVIGLQTPVAGRRPLIATAREIFH